MEKLSEMFLAISNYIVKDKNVRSKYNTYLLAWL